MSRWLLSDSLSGRAGIALFALRALLALFFAWLAWKSISGDPGTTADFRRFGYSDSFRVLIGCLQAAGAIAILFPPLAFWGACLLGAVLAGAIVSHLRFDPPAAAVSPIVFVALLAPVAIAYRPPALR